MDRPSVDLALHFNYTAFCHSHLTSHRLTLSRVWLSFIMARASPSTNLLSNSWTLSRLGSPSYTACFCNGPSNVGALHLTSQGSTFSSFSSPSYTAWTFHHGHLTSHSLTLSRVWLSFIIARYLSSAPIFCHTAGPSVIGLLFLHSTSFGSGMDRRKLQLSFLQRHLTTAILCHKDGPSLDSTLLYTLHGRFITAI